MLDAMEAASQQGLDLSAGLDWVAQHAVKPAVVTLSLGIPAGAYSQTLDAAVRSLVANSSITVVVASGAISVARLPVLGRMVALRWPNSVRCRTHGGGVEHRVRRSVVSILRCIGSVQRQAGTEQRHHRMAMQPYRARRGVHGLETLARVRASRIVLYTPQVLHSPQHDSFGF